MDYIAYLLEYLAKRNKQMNDFVFNVPSIAQTNYPISFYTVSEHYDQESINRKSSKFHQILVVLGGHGRFTCGGASYELRAGSAFFTSRESRHSYERIKNLETAFITATGPAADALADMFSENGYIFFESVDTESFIESIRKIKRELKNGASAARLSAITYSIFTSFLSLKDQTPSAYLSDTVRYIDTHFSQSITIKELADLSAVSVSKLCHDFKAKYGISVFEYVMEIRLTYARELLINMPTMSAKYIAESSGFSDPGYFTKAYKKRFGLTPSQQKNRR